ncbi:MAG: ArnT family glycosyltransferase [Terrimicrobiaceae bacterium]
MTSQRALLPCSFFVFLSLGLALRLWNLPDPVIDAMAPRQAQTADAIRSLIEEPGFQLDSNTSWRGASRPRFVQELPVYNFLAQIVYEGTDFLFYETRPPKPGGADPPLIDMSARIVSVFFWVLTFLTIQTIWSRFLTQREAFWANGLFVFAPLSVFFGQAVMPEMVFLFIATGFIVSVLRYSECPTLAKFWMVFISALLASLIKMPGFSHLSLFAVAILWRAQGFQFLLRPAHWVAGILILAAIKSWSGYVTAINMAGFPEWTSESSLRLFLGDPMARLKPAVYIKVGGYITAFLLSPLGVAIAGIGLWQAIRVRTSEKGFFALAWTASLLFYVLVWGTQTAGAHSYYNLPMLIPVAMLFGVGMGASLGWIGRRKSTIFASAMNTQSFDARRSTSQILFSAIVLLLVLTPMGVMTSYLFREDRALLAAAEWIQTNVPEGKIAAVKLNHSPYYIDYFHVPTVSYYARRNCFVIGRTMSDEAISKGLSECEVIVETLPETRDGMKAFSVAFKGAERNIDTLERARQSGFEAQAALVDGLRIWKKPNP